MNEAASAARRVKGGSMTIAAAAVSLALSGCVPSGFLPALSLRAPADDAPVHKAGPGRNGAGAAPGRGEG
ncbi:RND transporter, partial [Burkholderia contaminans]